MPRAFIPNYTSEAKFQAEVKGFAELYGWCVWHQLDSRGSQAGVADLIAWRDPMKYQLCLVIAELKIGKNVPSDAQHLFLSACAAMMLSPFLWYPKDWPQIEKVFTSEGAKPCPKPKETMTAAQVAKLFSLNKPNIIRLPKRT